MGRAGWLILLAAVAAPAQELRIGVLGLFHPTVLKVKAQGRETRIDLRSPRQVFPGPVTVEIPGRMVRRYEGRLEVNAVGGVLQPVVVMGIEQAAAVSAQAEAPQTKAAARKVQVVLARSYYGAGGRHTEFDFCDTTHCQLFQDPAPMSEPDTRGIHVAYEGARFQPLYFRSCGGRTLTAAAVGMDSNPYPYAAVECEGCARAPRRWNSRIPADAGQRLLDEGPSELLRLELGRRFGWSAIRSNSYRASREGAEIHFEGEGEGHGVGVCLRGVEDMARRGYDFRAILLKYLPGTMLLR